MDEEVPRCGLHTVRLPAAVSLITNLYLPRLQLLVYLLHERLPIEHNQQPHPLRDQLLRAPLPDLHHLRRRQRNERSLLHAGRQDPERMGTAAGARYHGGNQHYRAYNDGGVSERRDVRCCAGVL